MWHYPSREKYVRQRVGFSLKEARVVTGPQHRRLSAGMKLGKMDGPVGWRIPSKRRCVVQGEGASEQRFGLRHQGGCQNAPQTTASGRVSGTAQDCQMRSYSSLKGMFVRESASWREAAKPVLSQRSETCLWEAADLDRDRFTLSQLASSLGSTIQHITFEIFLIFSLYLTR